MPLVPVAAAILLTLAFLNAVWAAPINSFLLFCLALLTFLNGRRERRVERKVERVHEKVETVHVSVNNAAEASQHAAEAAAAAARIAKELGGVARSVDPSQLIVPGGTDVTGR